MLRALVLVMMFVVSPNLLAASQTRYVSEDIYVFIHGGPGNQYRILGSVEAGETVSLVETQGKYSKILDHKGREGWIKTEQLSSTPSFRIVVPQLQKQLANTQAKLNKALNSSQTQQSQLSRANSEIKRLNEDLENVTQERDHAKVELAEMIDNQNYEMWRQGGMIAGFGLILGLIIAYLPRPQRRRKKDRWM